LQCPDEKLLRRMRTFPLSTAIHLMPLLGSFRGYGQHTPGVRVLNGRGEPVHFNPLMDNHRPHGVIVGSNRSGKSALANWMANCLVPQGVTFIFMDRHGSYEALCRLHGGTHISFSREQPVCLGPFDGDLGPDHQDLLLTIMAEMATRLSRVTPQASSTLSNREALVLAQQLKRWAERGEIDSVPTLGQFVDYLGASTVETEICSTLVTLLSPYCGEGPFAAFIDGPAEVQLSQGLWSFDIAPLVNAGQLGAVVTTVLLGWVDRFIKAPEHLEVGKFLVMDEVSFDLKTPQAVELIDRHIRAYARFNAGMWLISQNMSDFRGEIGEIIRNNCGQFIAFALNPDEAQRFTDTFTPEAPHVVDMIKKLKPHRDCSQGFIYLPDGGSGAIRVVADPEFMTQIGQSRWHREQRHKRLEDPCS